MSSSFKRERAILRRRLQHHRRQLELELGDRQTLARALRPPSILEPDGTFPRSITMRLLTNRQNFLMMAALELVPLLVRYLLAGSNSRTRELESRD